MTDCCIIIIVQPIHGCGTWLRNMVAERIHGWNEPYAFGRVIIRGAVTILIQCSCILIAVSIHAAGGPFYALSKSLCTPDMRHHRALGRSGNMGTRHAPLDTQWHATWRHSAYNGNPASRGGTVTHPAGAYDTWTYDVIADALFSLTRATIADREASVQSVQHMPPYKLYTMLVSDKNVLFALRSVQHMPPKSPL
eukprot:1189930-Prorocentrum_minimum.AAC.2